MKKSNPANNKLTQKERAAIEQEAASFMAAISNPVDEAQFVYIFAVFYRALAGQIPGIDPTNREIEIEGIGTIRLTNAPVNIAMKAVNDELESFGVTDRNAKVPFMMRIMDSKEVMRLERFAKFVERQSDGVMISDALIKAFATAKYKAPNLASESREEGGFDLDDLYAKTEALVAKEKA